MEKWYRARFGKIEEIAVERSTEKFVILPSGRREAIDSDWTWYRREREQAKLAMVAQYEVERNDAKRALEHADRRVAEAQDA